MGPCAADLEDEVEEELPRVNLIYDGTLRVGDGVADEESAEGAEDEVHDVLHIGRDDVLRSAHPRLRDAEGLR